MNVPRIVVDAGWVIVALSVIVCGTLAALAIAFELTAERRYRRALRRDRERRV